LFRYYYPACEISTITKDVLGKEGLTNSKWMYAVGISQPVANELRDHLGRFGIETRPMFHNIYKHEHINPYSGMSTKRFNNLIEADEILQKSVVVLPSGPTLTEGEIEFIGTKVNEFAQEVHVSNF
jgi:dTDP-4-amino-4,6-dideoxygalactose transaminase